MMKKLIFLLFLIPLISFGQFYGLNRNHGGLPDVNLIAANNYLAYCTFYAEGEVISENGSAVTDRGFVINESPSPTITNTKLQYGSGAGSFSASPVYSNLSPSTTYYVRAYATNGVGTSYSSGSGTSFTTYNLPTVSASATSITSSSALIEGPSSSNGNMVNGIRVDYGTSSGTYPYSQSQSWYSYYNAGLTSLTASTTYYYKVWVQNAYCSWSSTPEQTFTTSASCTTLPDAYVIGFPNYPASTTSTTIDVQTGVDSDCPLASRRIHYNTTGSPALETDLYFAQPNTTGVITSTVTGLSPNTGYYFTIYARNANGVESQSYTNLIYTLP